MYPLKATLLLLATSALALPSNTPSKRALTFRKYADFQVSDGTAGNALEEVKAKFPIDENNLASVSDQDLSIIKAARETAEAAETDTFNAEIKTAGKGGSTALQNGKIKNKVLKLYLEVTALQIAQAKGNGDAAKIAAEQKKLTNNIGLDKKAAGQESQSVAFTGDVQPK